jgi:hypothetical protein
MMNILRLSFATFFIIAVSSMAVAQSTSFDIELGYQNVDVNGNEDMFKTQINQDSGFVLGNLSINFVDPSGGGFADRLRVDASGFGGNPAGRFRLDMGRGQTYRLRLFYQEFSTYSALPAYANPLLEDGVVPGQHTWDRTRNVLDIQLEFPIWKTITPIIGYRWNRYEGPGQSTYSVGNDEFRVASDLEQTESEFYIGLNFMTKAVHGTLIQGWRDFDGTERQDLAAGEGAGNNPGTTLGQDVELDSFDRTTRTSAKTPVTTFHITARASDQVRLIGSYVRADSEGDTSMDEMLSGSLVSFQLSRFFQGLDQTIESRTENPYSRGEVRFEFDLSRKAGFKVGYQFRERELRGWAMVSSLFTDTLNFGGFDPRDIETMVESESGYERQDKIANVRFDFRDLGLFSLWGEYTANNQSLNVSQDVAQIVLPGGQEGDFDRQIETFEIGGMLDFGDAKILLDLSSQEADEIIMRTDFNDRSRLRGRVDWSISKVFRVLATAESINSDNKSSDVGYEAETRRYAIDLDITPSENFMFGLAWDTYQTDTEIPYRVPQTLGTLQSIYAEDGELLTGDLRWIISILTIDAAYSTFENEGSFPFKMDRAFARVALDITKSIGIAGEYENWDYSEGLFPIADYDADRWGLFLRWHR